jgi:hypothetical protein
MPHLANLQQLTKPPIPGVSFPLPRKARWRPKTERSQTDMVNWRDISVALLESPEVLRIWQEIGASVVRTYEFELRLVERLYTFRRQAKVSQFLEEFPFLVPLLVEAYSKFGHYFGPYPRAFLEIVTDPEAPDDHELFALIYTSLTPDEALDRLDRFDRDWWLDASQTTQGKLCIDVEFL